MSKSHEDWDELKSYAPPEEAKENGRHRLWKSIRNEGEGLKGNKTKNKWRGLITACSSILVCGGLLAVIMNNNLSGQNGGDEGNQPEIQPLDLSQFSWGLEGVYAKKEAEGLVIYKENEEVPVGNARLVSEEEKEEITQSGAMYVDKQLAEFPYPTEMYIEHVKMKDTVLRYHFFIPDHEDWIYFVFDYPKLEYAEIFNLISTLKIQDREPYIHNEPLYVNHGYGIFLYPTDLIPVTVEYDEAVYIWENPSQESFAHYVEKLEASGWSRVPGIGKEITFESSGEIVEISWNDDELVYKYQYTNQEDE
ncbi:hypothetical protein [Cytobacillus purgationiresistens]|uniref:Uncharacterized protein n=1 Tax=Cytobacillus purgationiresistens TaxID=863449 RepID=A0ABU0AJM8_9BACI|nr:hypothetical protein [Cytobacillus purgationiresistens]MDQ0271468.1 hypothetical protein [Cytobacillus purgationiresistens]